MNTTANAVAAELRRLHVLLAEELGQLEAGARHRPPAELHVPLSQLRDHLAEHFQFEETNGYLAPILQREPHRERAAQILGEQHRELLHSLDLLLAEARQEPKADFADRLSAWVKALRRHEAEENRLYQDAFNVEIAGED
jgi:hemerythrin